MSADETAVAEDRPTSPFTSDSEDDTPVGYAAIGDGDGDDEYVGFSYEPIQSVGEGEGEEGEAGLDEHFGYQTLDGWGDEGESGHTGAFGINGEERDPWEGMEPTEVIDFDVDAAIRAVLAAPMPMSGPPPGMSLPDNNDVAYGEDLSLKRNKNKHANGEAGASGSEGEGEGGADFDSTVGVAVAAVAAEIEPMSPEHVQTIKDIMKTITLPEAAVPAWARVVDDDRWMRPLGDAVRSNRPDA